MENYWSILPFELVAAILNDNALWCALECAFPTFARYCRQNKVSFHNQTIRKRIFPPHLCEYELIKSGMKLNTHTPDIVYDSYGYSFEQYGPKKDISNCECFYCYNLKNDEFSGPQYSKQLPLVYQLKCEVWLTPDGVIHRDHAPAINAEGYACYVRMNKKHAIGIPAESNKTCRVESFYENGKICEDHYRKMCGAEYGEEEYLRDYYMREITMYHSDGRTNDEVAVHIWNTKDTDVLVDISPEVDKYSKEKQIDDINFESTGDGGFIANYKPAFSDGIMYLYPSKLKRHQREKYDSLKSSPNEIDELEELYINQKNKDEDFLNRVNNTTCQDTNNNDSFTYNQNSGGYNGENPSSFMIEHFPEMNNVSNNLLKLFESTKQIDSYKQNISECDDGNLCDYDLVIKQTHYSFYEDDSDDMLKKHHLNRLETIMKFSDKLDELVEIDRSNEKYINKCSLKDTGLTVDERILGILMDKVINT